MFIEANNVILAQTRELLTKEEAIELVKNRVKAVSDYEYENLICPKLHPTEAREMERLKKIKDTEPLNYWDNILAHSNPLKQNMYQCINYEIWSKGCDEQEKIVNKLLKDIELYKKENVYFITLNEYFIYLDTKLGVDVNAEILNSALKKLNKDIISKKYNKRSACVYLLDEQLRELEAISRYNLVCRKNGFKLSVLYK